MTWLDLYFWFRDQGSAVGGGLALAAGGALYYAGERQARATRDAAQMQREDAAKALRRAERRERRNLAYLLQQEALRIASEARLRIELLGKAYWSNDENAIINPGLREPHKIRARLVLRAGQNIPNLLKPETCDALAGLLASLDLMNSRLEILTQTEHLFVADFLSALKTVEQRADAAISQLAQELRTDVSQGPVSEA